MNVKKQSNKVCCYCGVRTATTRDHVPPKAIFNKPRPSNLITVPCCLECNHQASLDDERFKVYLGLQVAIKGNSAEKLFKEGVIPTIKHNNSYYNHLISSTCPEPIIDASTGKINIAIQWDDEANKSYESTISRMTRGLFFNHYNKIVPVNAKIETYWFEKDFQETEYELNHIVLVPDTFEYRYTKALDDEWTSIWHFNFYNGLWGGATIFYDSNNEECH